MSVEELATPPPLPGLYAKALAGLAVPGRPSDLPERRLVLREQRVDVERLADYCRVCGFALGPALPPTYPHLLGFPLELELMGSRSFPFPILGVVHVANRIEQRRPIPVDARFDVVVWAEGLRRHRRGRQLDLVTEIEVDGGAVWREYSTYLRPGGADEGSTEQAGSEPEARSAPAEAAISGAAARDVAAVWTVPGDIGRRYGEVSGDRNPIHMRSLTAKPFGFAGAIAHGMWTMARCLATLEARLPAALAAGVEFRAPLCIPGRAELRVSPLDGGCGFTVAPAGSDRPHLTGTAGPA